ncbi:MAG TPA: peptide chain release factor N(5)-glutamine methyltransferase [Anaerolineae bacterium]|nr:peptide chain release factor N(5)-glutamine methyltransferase [Anaerolineae bacterium]
MTGERCGSGNLTVQAALRDGTARLAEAGVEEARLDAEVLLAHALGVGRAYLFAHPERCLSPEEAAAWQGMLERRRQREPVAYIVGTKEFYDLELAVDRRVLVPRPETEMIVERVLEFAAEHPVRTVWDVGTGSGALALALAQHLPQAHVVGSDVSPEALQVAAENRRRLGLEGRVELVESDLLAEARGPIDVVVANPPYLPSDEYRAAMPEVSQYEPRLALDGGPTGLDAVARLLAQAAALRPQPALLLVEIGAEQGPEAVALAREHFPQRPVALRRDLAGLDRVVEVSPSLRSPSPIRGRGADGATALPSPSEGEGGGEGEARHERPDGHGGDPFQARPSARHGAQSPLTLTLSPAGERGQAHLYENPRRPPLPPCLFSPAGERGRAHLHENPCRPPLPPCLFSPAGERGQAHLRSPSPPRGMGGVEGVTWVLPAQDPAAIALVAEALRRGEIAAFPTDTVYGVGAAVCHEAAVRALYEIKGRPEAKAIPLLLAGAADLEGVATAVPAVAARLMARYWPGPLTLVLPARPELPAEVRAGMTVAVRVPDHEAARALIEAVGAPLATTSANRSGAPAALTARDVLAQLGRRLRWVLDGGPSPGGQASSVVDVTAEPPAICRHGAIPDEALQPLLGDR